MATILSTQDGLASSTATWAGGVVPVDGDEVNILHEVTIDGEYTWGSDSGNTNTGGIIVKNGGTLKASRTVSTKLICKGTLYVENYGTLDYGRTGDVIPASITAEIVLNYSDTLSQNKYGMTVYQYGSWFSHGAEKRQVALSTVDISWGDDTITLDDVDGFNVGDEIGIPTTENYGDTEYGTISAINGNILTISNIFKSYTNSTQYTYFSEPHAAGIKVCNLTTNVRIYAYDKTYETYVYTQCYLANSRDIRYTEVAHMDQNTTTGFNYGFSTREYVAGGTIAFSNNVIKFSYRGLDFSGNLHREFCTDCIVCNVTNAGGVYTRSGARLTFTRGAIFDCLYASQSSFSQGGADCVFEDTDIAGCSYAIFHNPSIGFRFINCRFDANDRVVNLGQAANITLEQCQINMGVGSPHSYEIVACSPMDLTQLLLSDCEIGTGSYSYLVRNQGYALDANKIIISNLNLDPLQQFVFTNAGTLIRDNDFYRSGSPSVKISCINDDVPFKFSLNVYAPTGSPVVVSGYMQKDSAYVEATLPEVTLSGLGITPDTFIIEDIDDEWQQFKVQGTQNSGADGMLTLTFKAQSAAGVLWVDDVVAPVAKAVNSGEFGYWSGGQPVASLLANFVSAGEVWNVQENELTLAGSIGKAVEEIKALVETINTETNKIQPNIIDNSSNFKADVSNLDVAVSSRSVFNPTSDTVSRVTLVDTVTDNTDMRGTDNANTTNPWEHIIEAGFTAEQVMRVMASLLAGQAEVFDGGAIYKGIDETTDRVVAEFDDDGNRTSIVLDGA